MDYQSILDAVARDLKEVPVNGRVASYIPELACVDPDQFGMHLSCLEQGQYWLAQHEQQFSIQSISKVLSLTLAMSLVGEEVWKRVGVEPSGDPFNSMVQLEFEHGIPRNPLINAGALVIADILCSQLSHPKEEFLEFVRMVSGTRSIDFNHRVAHSERDFGHRNAALIHLMKSFSNINNPIEQVLDFYFHQCSLEMNCEELAHTFLLFANQGSILSTGKSIITKVQSKRVNALMQTCGFYDEAGEFSFRVGLPGKSGVGGGIAAVHPGYYSVAVWSPRLNRKGNSLLGMHALELLTSKSGLSIF